LTRQTTAEAIFYLVRDDEVQYKAVMGHLAALVPYAGGDDGMPKSLLFIAPQSHLFLGPYVYDLAFQFDRSKSIRSHTGYVGLRNLSNTCYLNSLFTQLFMNIPFREFMLEAYVADGGASQKLLSETQNLFSYMQNSLRRFVDPANIAGSIRTSDETPIDVTIQMDVDEFFLLLFERWESQILAADAKKRFKSFYGGQLVQQIKSKECSHISERLDPFSAIQCDIKGKTCLQESLQAYVDGDIMEGDNKWKCSTCDRHVDAVKRACLKDVPDNLIFHLKRFEYNLRTQQRSKINDYFSFPTKIDMRPYKVEHLMDNPEDTPEDIFELVGILVHSGTAESGHYYSFIRERPSNGDKENWVEFNDDCVSPWDPTCMEGSCFGGPDYRGPVEGGNLQFDKSWNAYMLFYQRSSTLATQKQTLNQSRLSSPVRLPVPQRLANHIAMENELLIRKYCLYDPAHAVFVTKMLSNMRQINGGQCSVSHDLEKLVLTSSLNHLDQVIARTKDLPDFPTFMLTVRQLCHSCAECSRDYLEWYCDCPETLRHLLLRNPDGVVRSEIAGSILAALNKVKRDASYAYGFGDDDDSADDLEGGDPRVIQRVVKSINKLWDMFHTNLRAWPEYFGLLFSIAKMGKREAAVLLDTGFLFKALNIVSADHLLAMGAQYTKMLNIISKRLTTRPVSFDAVISLLCQLIQTCDASREPLSERTNRVQLAIEKKPIPFTEDEQALLVQHWLSNRAHIMVEKLLQIHQNPAATEAIIVNLLSWPDSIDTLIYQAITHGIRKVVSSVPCAAFLRAALIYCEHSRSPKAIPTMVIHVSRTAQHLENTEGKEFLQFFKDITTISSQTEMSKLDLFKFYLDQLCCWGPGLLTYYDASVRSETEDFIQELLLRHGPDVDFGPSDDDVEKSTMITQGTQKLGIACLDYLDATYVRSRQTAVRATLVNIEAVIEACREFFAQNSPDALTRRFQDLMDSRFTRTPFLFVSLMTIKLSSQI
jgi:ubiquitin carboxyl-terminal hydrolase 34